MTFGPDSVLVVGNDRSLRELSLPDLAPSRAQDSGILVAHASLSNNRSAVFAGSVEPGKPGYVRAYAYPLSGDFDDYACGSGAVTSLRVTSDETFVITADENGCLSIFECRDTKDRFQRQDPTEPPGMSKV